MSGARQSPSGSLGRRSFLRAAGLGAAAISLPRLARSAEKPIQDLAGVANDPEAYRGWVPVSDRRIRVGLVGYGVCKFAAAFGFQDHPNVEIVAVSDLFPDRCAALAKATRCAKTYPSLEEMLNDDRIEAVFLATDAASHSQQSINALKRGKHVAVCVPAVFGSLEDADTLIKTVKSTGLNYMMYETSCFHADLYAMHRIYEAGGFGRLVYSEGEYYHYLPKPLASYRDWRIGLPPQWYPTHSNAYYVGVTGKSFTEVSCMGMPSKVPHFRPENNRYQNPFGTEIALFRTSEGGMSRMTVSKDVPANDGVAGRVRGQLGAFYDSYKGEAKNLPVLKRPPLPPGMPLGGHKGSHGYLTHEFVLSILEKRKPWIDVAMALNLTVPGIIAHQSAMKGGELLKIPQYSL